MRKDCRFAQGIGGATAFLFIGLVIAACGSTTAGRPIAAELSGSAQSITSTSATTTATAPDPHAPFPTLAAPELQPPKQKNYKRPDVVVDPCTWFDDETIRRIGMDPTTRERALDLAAEYTFLACDFQSLDKTQSLSIMSGNWAFDGEGRRNFEIKEWKIEDITIAGRRAMRVHPKGQPCLIALETHAGYITFQRDFDPAYYTGPKLGPCEGIPEIIEELLPRIGEN